MRARLRRAGHSSTFGFTVRLSVAIAATFALLGIAGYVMMGEQLQRRLIDTYAGEHRADARSLADAQVRAPGPAAARRRITALLGAMAARPGVSEAVIVGRDSVVVAAGDQSAVGDRESDARIDRALRRGEAYVGHAADPRDSSS